MSYLIYDGECPFCSRYVEFLALKERFPDIELLDARENEDHQAVQMCRKAGIVIDEGMVLVDGETILHGADVMQFMAADEGLYGKFFKSPGRSRFLYPFLRTGRNLALRLLGKDKLGF